MIRISSRLTHAMAVLVLGGTVAACSDSTDVPDPGTVAVNFQVTTGFTAQAAGPALSTGTDAGRPLSVAGPPLVLEGSNGTLTIQEIHLIVAEVELEGDDDACEAEGLVDDCAEVEGPPRFLDLPLDGTHVEAFLGVVPADTYYQLELEIEDLEDDEDDTEFAAEIAALRDDILALFPDWPREATARVVGSFENGDGRMSFVVYLEAEIEVERDLVPPLVIGGGGVASDLTVNLRPDIWFGRSDGTVLPLHLWDYGMTGQVLEFELEMEEGIAEIEIED